MQIPLLNLKRQTKILNDEIIKALDKVISDTNFIMGTEVEGFEQEIADFLDCKYAISCANGTDALILSLESLGITKGDEVITTPFTFFATAEAISRVGATPIFIDVRRDTYNIDPYQIKKHLTSKTKAILPVHIFGQPADMDKVMDIAKQNNLYVIEDACQAIGAKYKDRKVGGIGDIGCFSFYPTKNLGAFGDGGMITTNEKRLALILKGLRVHGSGNSGRKAYNVINGLSDNELKFKETKYKNKTVSQSSKYYNYLIGYNSRLDEIQASILRIKLKYLDIWNQKRKEIAMYYNEKLKNTSLTIPYVSQDVKSVYHLFVVQSNKREKMINFLNEKEISTGRYYPTSLHLQKAYHDLNYNVGDLKNAEYLSKRTFALPLYPELSREEQNYIIEAIYEFDKKY
ncbi:MAG: DegT/DnrJ/EryC1/StrS family aminotransferase [Firmicutes bacterium]|nr:DegT/DnrJ/EryC1/StrS family aminotransferase [Bacillota bacterium]